VGLFDATGFKKRESVGDFSTFPSLTSQRPARSTRQQQRSSTQSSVASSGRSRTRDFQSITQAQPTRAKTPAPTRGMTIQELQKFLSDRGLAPVPTTRGLSTRPTRSQRQTTTTRRPAASAGAGGAAPTTSMTRAGVPTAQLGTLFGSPLNIPARVQQSLTGQQLTGGLFDIIGGGKRMGIQFPSTSTFRRLLPSERKAAQAAAKLKGFSAEDFQAGILRSSPGDRPRPSIDIAPRRSRVRV